MKKWWPLHVVRESFIAKISLTLIAGILVLAFLFDLMLMKLQWNTFAKENIKHGLFLSRMLSQSVKLAVLTENKQNLIMPVRAILEHDDVVEAAIFNNYGVMLYKDNKERANLHLSHALDNPEQMVRIFKTVEQSGEMHWQTKDCFVFWWPIYFTTSADVDEESLYFELDGEPPRRDLLGYTAVVISKKSYKSGIRHVLLSTGAIVICFLIAGIAMAVLVVRRMVSPLSDLLHKVKEETGGTGAGDDLSRLSESYGGLIQGLDVSFATIKELKNGLEKKVGERTMELSRRQLQLESANMRLAKTLAKLQEAQLQLVQSEKMAAMGQMVAGVAHEINNSINFISGALPSVKRLLGDLKELLAGYERLEQVRDGDDRARNIAEIQSLKNDIEFAGFFNTFDRLLANIEEGTTRTTRIIKDLNVFTRQGAERFMPTDIHALINSTIPFIDSKLLKGVEIRKEFGDIGPVTCLAGRISQVFLNIMQNAAHAMSGHGTLTIRTWQADDQVHISFTDTGCGIEKNVINRIFDPFFTTKEVGKGSGLGLGISYDIVKQHSGSINVASEIGLGTVFEVILPLSPPVVPEEMEG